MKGVFAGFQGCLKPTRDIYLVILLFEFGGIADGKVWARPDNMALGVSII